MNKNTKRLLLLVVMAGMLMTAFLFVQSSRALAAPSLTNIELLGKFLFFDQNLSKNSNQSCATCHDPAVGYTGPDSAINTHGAVYPGSVPALFGNRKPPSVAYAGDSTSLYYDDNLGAWRGGMFWDGRADGSVLGDPLAEQAKGPFLNPLEQALASPEELWVLPEVHDPADRRLSSRRNLHEIQFLGRSLGQRLAAAQDTDLTFVGANHA